MSGYLYLFFQIWVWIIASFIFGWFAHWFFCCRGKETDHSEDHFSATTNQLNDDSVEVIETKSVSLDESWKPEGFASAPDDADDLKRIKGVGSVIEETLNDLGIYQFEQIAKWSDDNVSWLENFLAFPGRIAREEWIEQAKALNAGEVTEFANRVDKGDVDYS